MSYAPTVLHLNLSDRSSKVQTYEELAPMIGGLGWALGLFEEGLEKIGGGSDGSEGSCPSSERDDPVVFAIGPLSAVSPGCSKTIAVFRSPQNGFLATSLGGGYLARALRFAGYQALVISGSSKEPLVVSIDGELIAFEDGSALVGKDVPTVFKSLFGSKGVPGKRSILASGSAAEQGIAFSPLYIDEFFSFPRGGLGSVFACKNLKGLVVSGGGYEDIESINPYKESFSTLLRKLGGFEDLGRQGTLRNLQVEKKISAVPFENLNEPNFDDQHRLGESFLGSRRLACSGCPVGCIQLTKPNGGYIPYDYDAVAALGPLIGLTSKEKVSRLLDETYRVGLDPVSLGAILAYLTEKNKLAFGDVETYLTLIDALLEGKEEWARPMRQGLAAGAKVLGDEELALVLGGLEALPYFNGYATLLTQALSLGATTEENRGYLIDLDFLEGSQESRAIVFSLLTEERRKILLELLVGCGHLASVFGETAIAFAALEALGIGVRHEELEAALDRTFRHFLMIQRNLGFDPLSAKIPAKFFSIPSPQGILEERKLKEMIALYLKEVDWAAP